MQATSISNTVPVSFEVMNTDHLYTDAYAYSLPQPFLTSFIEGNSFGRKEKYTPHEMNRLAADIQTLYSQNVGGEFSSLNGAKVAFITAGAPGAGKTVLLENHLQEVKDKDGIDLAYTDPDAVCLKNMEQTWKLDIQAALDEIRDQKGREPTLDEEKEIRYAAYNKWRPASNGVHHLITGNLIKNGASFCFGTTATGDKTNLFFKHLKDQGYKIVLLHVTAPDEVRWESIQRRDREFVQTTQEDITEKGKLLPQRIQDAFLAYADEIQFFYRDTVDADAIKAAVWMRGDNVPASLKVLDQQAYSKIKAWHNESCENLNRGDLTWSETVDKSLFL